MGTERPQPGLSAVQAAILARLRQEPPLSQAALAREAQVKPQQLSDWLNGKHRPRRAQLVKLAVPLGVPVEVLEEEPNETPARDSVAVPQDVASVLAELARWADLLAPTAPDGSDLSLLDALDRARECSRRLAE